eukprot:CAMPEP_0119024182 /NCGR_PEP_ID=MMETSP1176-20130426/31406_1 /TAXON_ID=265551 /ORGANISM="Synedropsis recta cf, Strain CCMP1620" /LENGTH=256 /DNA_ID=CAMNT_0006979407 /DNA_START=97 /DNA_END=866 /DNA_ORIENTATION=+
MVGRWKLIAQRKKYDSSGRESPLTDNYFRDIHYDSISGNVVGILTKGPPAKGQILVDASGKVIGKTPAIVFVTTWRPGVASARTTSSSTRSEPTAPATAREPSLSDEQNRNLIKYAAYAIGGAMALRLLLSTFFALYILAFPAVFLYALQTLPSAESFDAKKEIKRVMRGAHLPEDHVEKPRGWLGETVARVQASVATELATGLGYEVSMYTVIHAIHMATVNVPSVNRGYVWAGAFGKWRYLYSTELESNPDVST